jgi:Tfp pilus assembly protein PilZ
LGFLLSYMEYIESIGLFTPRILKFFFAQIMFLPIKIIKREKKQLQIFRLSRAAAAVDRILCPAYSLDHKT